MLGKIILFSGYAGAGKNTIINELLKRDEDLCYMPSVTTRKKRMGERDGSPYIFLDEDVFFKKRQQEEFVEAEKIHGNWYGTLSESYEKGLNEGSIIVKDIDVNGAMEFKKLYGDKVYLVFIKPTDELDVIKRMIVRGDSEEEIDIRKER